MLSSDEVSKLSGPGLLSIFPATKCNSTRKTTHDDVQVNESKKVLSHNIIKFTQVRDTRIVRPGTLTFFNMHAISLERNIKV